MTNNFTEVIVDGTTFYDLSQPLGVGGRNSDNAMIRRVLGWEPSTPLRTGMAKTYAWIEEQYARRKAGQTVVL